MQANTDLNVVLAQRIFLKRHPHTPITWAGELGGQVLIQYNGPEGSKQEYYSIEALERYRRRYQPDGN